VAEQELTAARPAGGQALARGPGDPGGALLPAADGGVELVARFFRALGDPARLRLLEFLLKLRAQRPDSCRIEDVQQLVRLNNGEAMAITVRRDGQLVKLDATPILKMQADRFGHKHEFGQLGIGRSGVEYVKRNPATAVVQAVSETWNLSTATLEAMWQIVIGTRASDELGGPLLIGKMAGEVAETGLVPLLWFMAVLSINLGLINLFPVPVLDGGHLLFYAAEAIRGKPLGQRAQEYGFRIGLALVLTLMVFATWNDLVHLRIVEFVKGLVT